MASAIWEYSTKIAEHSAHTQAQQARTIPSLHHSMILIWHSLIGLLTLQ